jgi:hypothetical protein
MAPGVCGGYHDDAIYVSTGEALATGQGYRLIDVPGEPLQTKYPWIYPAILSVVWYVWPSFPANVVLMQVMTLGFGAATVAVAYLYLVRFGYCTRKTAAGAALICATAPYFLYVATLTMAEMPFALLSLLALWGVEGFLLQPKLTRRRQFVLGCVLSLPFLCRTIGATVIVAGLVVLLQNRRPLRWYAVGALCAVAPWILWSATGCGIWDQNPVDGYYTDYFGCWSSTGLSMAGRVVSQNAQMVAHGSAMMSLEGVAALAGHCLGINVAGTMLMVVGLATWLVLLSDLSKFRALPWMLAAYLAAMLVWSWPPYRFLVPILPFLAAYVLSACSRLLKRGGESVARRLVRSIGVGAIVAANAGLLVSHAVQIGDSKYPLPKSGMTPVAWSSYKAAFAWLRDNSRPEDVIAAGFDSMFALYTDRSAVRPYVYSPGRLFYGEGQEARFSVDEIVSVLEHYRPRYLVGSPMPGFAEEEPLAEAIEKLRQQCPDWVLLRYQGADRRFMIFELDWMRHTMTDE